MAVVVIVTYAASLPPAGLVFESGAGGNIGKRAIPVVLEEMTARFVPGREALKPPAIHEEDVEPAIRIIGSKASPQPVVSSKYLLVFSPP